MGQIWASKRQVDVQVRKKRRTQNTSHNTLTSLYRAYYGVYGSLFIRSLPFARGEIMAFPRKRNLGFAKSLPL